MNMRLAGSGHLANMSSLASSGTTSAADPVRVAIVEDDATTRDGLAALIDGTRGYRCVGRYGSVEELVRTGPDESPHVVLLDINLPGMTGTDGVRVIRRRWPAAEVLMLTVYSEPDRIFESICNGAVGYLLKKTPPTRLLDAIREAVDGGAPMSPEIARKVVMLFRRAPPLDATAEALTPQELKLLQALADGQSYQAAAERLEISINTVRSYVRNIYDKLHVHSKSEAVSKALRNRLIV